VNETRAVATLSLFAVGILLGVVVHSFFDRGPGENPYPTLPKVEEPRAAHDVVAAIGADDAQSLSRLIDSKMLTDLDAAIQPITDVRSTKFVGAVESEGRLLSAYVVTGKTTEGIDFVVGFVLRVSNDQVVGVN
jgi:hypothetical protein